MSIEPIYFLVLLAGACFAAPVDGPIRIDLPVYDEPRGASTQYLLEQPKEASSILLAEPLELENHPGGEPLKNSHASAGNLVSYKIQQATKLLDTGHGSKQASFDFGGPFSAPVTTRETALLETEGYASKALSFKENIQNVAAGLFQPKPIVDTISESEKYGNTGDKFYVAGKALVGGAEGISNVINSALEVPGSILKKITRVATEKLNNFGGRLIGL